MAMGPGAYDELATLVRERAKADGVMLVVINGEKGSGFSCQLPLVETLRIPAVLRSMADAIERDLRAGLPQA